MGRKTSKEAGKRQLLPFLITSIVSRTALEGLRWGGPERLLGSPALQAEQKGQAGSLLQAYSLPQAYLWCMQNFFCRLLELQLGNGLDFFVFQTPFAARWERSLCRRRRERPGERLGPAYKSPLPPKQPVVLLLHAYVGCCEPSSLTGVSLYRHVCDVLIYRTKTFLRNVNTAFTRI